MSKIMFPLKISFIVSTLHIFLFLQQAKCYPHDSPKSLINIIPSDDCPVGNLCENPAGYPKQWIREELLRKRKAAGAPPHIGPVSNIPAYNTISVQKPIPVLIPVDHEMEDDEIITSSADVAPNATSYATVGPEIHNILTPNELTHEEVPVLMEPEHFHEHTFKDSSSNSQSLKLCPSSFHTLHPRSGTSYTGNRKYYIVNEDDLFVQKVHIEKCGSGVFGAECRFVVSSENIRTVCKQKYIAKDMIAVTEKGFETIKFKIPSYCCCELIYL